jgi:hypothetical protein
VGARTPVARDTITRALQLRRGQKGDFFGPVTPSASRNACRLKARSEEQSAQMRQTVPVARRHISQFTESDARRRSAD